MALNPTFGRNMAEGRDVTISLGGGFSSLLLQMKALAQFLNFEKCCMNQAQLVTIVS